MLLESTICLSSCGVRFLPDHCDCRIDHLSSDRHGVFWISVVQLWIVDMVSTVLHKVDTHRSHSSTAINGNNAIVDG